MPSGTVKKWVDEKGFGFLLPDGGGNDVFVHRSALVGLVSLSAGDRVTYEAKDDGKCRGKFKAFNVVISECGCSADRTGGLFADLPVAELPSEPTGVTGAEFFLEVAGEDSSALPAIEAFIVKSSLGCPFLVVSEGQLVATVRAPTVAEFRHLLGLVNAYVTGCETCCTTMIADFEGEMPGHGGELLTAQFQLTCTVDGGTLTPHPLPSGSPTTLGLLVDLRTRPCITLVRRIMESSRITKLMWGANGECQSLMYQARPMPLRVQPVAVVDIQSSFRGFGMATMLVHVPKRLLVGLPKKEQIDFDGLHSVNRRAFALPLTYRSVVYAIDDIHRIEAILRSKIPPAGNYTAARLATERMLSELRADPLGLQALGQRMGWFETRSGVKRTKKAVEIQRHILSLRDRGVELGADKGLIDQMEEEVVAELRRAGVTVPEDLSFSAPAALVLPSRPLPLAVTLPWQ